MSKMVSVSQAEGEISISVGGSEPRKWQVNDHIVEVDESDLSLFIGRMENATLVDTGNDAQSAKPAEDNKETDQHDGSPPPDSAPKLHRRKDQKGNS